MKEKKFWNVNSDGKVKIIESKLIEFLYSHGFAKAETSSLGYIYVIDKHNLVEEIRDHSIIEFVQSYLLSINENDVYEEFLRKSSGLISNQKLRFLKKIKILNDRDAFNSSWFHFPNLSWQVDRNSFRSFLRKDISHKIWKLRILKNPCFINFHQEHCQFHKFCYNISGKNDERFKCLTTIIGYLLHRNYDPSNAKAVIFLDENISYDGAANGGTGKSLLLAGIGECRKVVVVNGKDIKTKSTFKNQRIDRTTDIVFYDDVTRDFSLESLYSMITTGISVEKKYKDEEYIKPENAPKICISSNYSVKGTGGSTDIRRRCEFELSTHYSPENTPYDEFGNYFFLNWDAVEWNQFYHFMMSCVQAYLKYGLLIPEPINLAKNSLVIKTSENFVEFLEQEMIVFNKWLSKKKLWKKFTDEYTFHSNLTKHQFTKWMKEYANFNGAVYEDRKSGKKYEFYLKSIKTKGDHGEEE